jgi:hypothetical protein
MVHKDFSELLALFNEQQIDYMIVGAHALAFYGSPRYTGDMDIFVRPDEENANRIIRALDLFGFGSLELKPSDFTGEGFVVQLGVPPVRIDIVTSITGVSWDEAAANRIKGPFGDVQAYYIGKEQFIANKRSLGRKKDLADLEAIGAE